MTDINLLPWREQLREELQKEFLIVFGGALILSALIILATHMFFAKTIDNQNYRNSVLTTEIRHLESRIQQIKELKEKKERLIARMNIIQELQTNRPLLVHLFDSMVNIIPKGIHVDFLKRSENSMTLNGFAESNTQVSDLMRQIDNDEWVESSRLTEIKAEKSIQKQYNEKVKRFVLTLNIKRPDNAEDDDDLG